jgi:putative membrane protein
MWWCANRFGWNGFGWGGAIFGGLMMLLFWGILIGLAFFAIRALLRANQGRSGAETALSSPGTGRALQILRDRYARGEISQAEYEQIRKDLQG